MAESMGIPGMGGGLMRYKEEYNSKFKFGPGVVVAMIIITIAFVIGLRMFYA
ncbi:preprotein translocase subunit Sec61beta [Candidatus Pacearchaeota archaeon]|nr:preprotein translocase subunit Sec61beta [Candidatus Pacearchaeota archaeon]